MNARRTAHRTALALLALSLAVLPAAAQGYGAPPPVMDPATAMSLSPAQWDAYMNQYQQQMDAYTNRQMAQARQDADRAYADLQRFFLDYYRQTTGDYVTPDAQAVALGDRLYCQNNPVQCRQTIEQMQAVGRASAQGHAQSMQGIQSWGATSRAIGESNGAVLDASHQGFMERQAAGDAGQANYVQGAVRGEASYVGPYGGPAASLPIYPTSGYGYSGTNGSPVQFDYGSQTWYQQGYDGLWYPMQQQP